jgi:hypothetical protein
MVIFMNFLLALRLCDLTFEWSIAENRSMQLYKYRAYIFLFFISIFTLKMISSAMPLFICLDKCTVKSFILEQEQEHGTEGDSSKDLLKYTDYKYADIHCSYIYVPLLQECGIKNCYIDHSKRYVNPYHPSVPTPPPNPFVI